MKSTSSVFLDKIDIAEILNGFPHGGVILDRDLRIVEMNSSFELLTGFRASDARGVSVVFILRCNIGNDGKLYRKVLATGEPLSVEGDMIKQDHKKIPVHLTISSLKDGAGIPVGLFVCIEDISILHSCDQKVLSPEGVKDILGHSPKMLEMLELIPMLSHTDASVLITGETGTGKDLIAEAIHKTSKRSRYPFIKINCGALPEALLESELFGHVRGAFTGAVKDKPGLFRLAQNGTVFLTEIGDLPLSLQVKLLSVLDDREFFPVGGEKKERVNVRIIAATNRVLRELVKRGEFREDLFYRLNVLRLQLPALRERDGDIRLLLDYFLRKFNTSLNKSIKEFSVQALSVLTAYKYPGNVRELRNIVEYAVHICPGNSVEKECLPEYIAFQQSVAEMTEEQQMTQTDNDPPPRNQAAADKITDSICPERGWSDVEKEMIIDALRKTGGNRSKAAQILGWGRTTLWRKLNRYSLN